MKRDVPAVMQGLLHVCTLDHRALRTLIHTKEHRDDERKQRSDLNLACRDRWSLPFAGETDTGVRCQRSNQAFGM